MAAALTARIPAVSFPTIEFAAFVVVFIPSWALMPHPRARQPFILVASYVFYGWVDWRWVLILIGSSVVNTFAAQVIARSPSASPARALAAAVVFDLGLLCVFKYLGFFVSELDSALDGIGLGPAPLVQIVPDRDLVLHLPGDLVRGGRVPRRDARRLARGGGDPSGLLPHLAAGLRSCAASCSCSCARRATRARCWRPGLFLIAGGLVKKTVIADELARNVVDPVYNDPAAHSGAELTLAFYAFAAQIYRDFSGYTDMAIGLALLLGYQLPQNFNRPYMAPPCRTSEALAHDALALAARLPLHPARGQPRREPDVPQPDADDAAGRPLARRLVDVRLLGRDPRSRAVRRALARAALRQLAARLGGARDLQRGLRWVFFRAPDLGIAFDVLGGLGPRARPCS